MVYTTEQEFPPAINSPLPIRQIHRDRPFTSIADSIAQSILKGIKGHNLVISEDDAFLRLMNTVLQTETAQNELHFCKTCDDSDHFKTLFIAHWVEKLVETLRQDKDFTPNSQNIGKILKAVDQELAEEEDDFQLNDKGFLSWRECDGHSPCSQEDVLMSANASDDLPPLGSDGYLTEDLYTESSIL